RVRAVDAERQICQATREADAMQGRVADLHDTVPARAIEERLRAFVERSFGLVEWIHVANVATALEREPRRHEEAAVQLAVLHPGVLFWRAGDEIDLAAAAAAQADFERQIFS